MWIPDFIFKWFGQDIAKDLKLGGSMDNVPWYQNKSTLAHIVTALVGVATAITGVLTTDFHVSIPASLAKIGGVVLAILAGVGIYDNHS